MSKYDYSLQVFFEELLRISSNFIWKNPKLALENELQDYMIDVEQYKLAVQGRLTFDLIYKFDVEALMNAGVLYEDALIYTDNSFLIPENIREICAKKQMEYVLTHYDEHNNYYRMLNGLPDREDTDFFYNKLYPEISDDITPIHQLDQTQLYLLESKGFISELIKENPEKKYLDHLTSKKIDIYTARNSEDYAILWITSSYYTKLLSDFRDTYNECRQMVMAIYYQKDMEKSNSEYTGFIGITILFATLIHMNRKVLDTDITRDFYDEESLQYVYDSYGVPYYDLIPIEYHKKIVQNINILISHKGSVQVFYDIFNIFGFNAVDLYEYFIMKIHKFVDGKPVFARNPDGTLNYKKMYEIKFAKVKLYNNPPQEMLDQKNHVDYYDLTRNDPYWIDDEDLQNKIYGEEYNYMESKYFGIQTTFNLMKIMYESCYYLKMVIDNRELLSGTKIYYNKIHAEVNLFDLIIYLCALITRKYGFEGNIPTDLHQIGKVMGFNFVDNIVEIRNHISESDYLQNDKKLLDLLSNMAPVSLETLNEIYSNLTELRSYLVRKMAETDDVNVYWAYYELYQTMMYSEYANSVFHKSDGTPADSFVDLLKDINQDLYSRYVNELDTNTEFLNALYLLEKSCNSLKNLHYLDMINNDTILEYVFKLLDFFKSAKTELTGYKIVYSLVSSSENIMKLMNTILWIHDDHTSDPQCSIFDELTDIIVWIHDKMKLKTQFEEIKDDIMWIHDKTWITDMINYLQDEILSITEIVYDCVSQNNFYDKLSLQEIYILPNDPLHLKDSVTLLYDEVTEIIKYFVKDDFPYFVKIMKVSENIPIIEERLDFVIRLMLTEWIKQRLKSKYELKDEIRNDTEIKIVDPIWKKLEDALKHEFENMKLDSILDFKEDLSLDESSPLPKNHQYTMSDDILKRDEISIGINYSYRMIDSILHRIMKSVIIEDASFKEILSSKELYNREDIGEYRMFDYIAPRTNQHTLKHSESILSDQLFLLYEKKIEE